MEGFGECSYMLIMEGSCFRVTAWISQCWAPCSPLIRSHAVVMQTKMRPLFLMPLVIFMHRQTDPVKKERISLCTTHQPASLRHINSFTTHQSASFESDVFPIYWNSYLMPGPPQAWISSLPCPWSSHLILPPLLSHHTPSRCLDFPIHSYNFTSTP